MVKFLPIPAIFIVNILHLYGNLLTLRRSKTNIY